MGTINHNVIIATTWDDKRFNQTVKWLKKTGIPFVSFESGINNYNTIFIGPDGSKEGWPESATADKAREDFLKFIKKHEYADKSSPWSWVEVGYGEYGQKVLRGNNQNCYGNGEYAEWK